MFVHAFEPKWHPAAAGLKVSDLQFGEFLQHAVSTRAETGEHLFQRVAGNVPAEFAVAIRAGLFEHGASPLVDAERHPRIRSDLINWK
jgi:hypothetical protein